MASWGNQTGDQFTQPMDSNGEKLKIRSTSGAYSASNYRVDIEEGGDTPNSRALRVKGGVLIEKQTNQTSPVLKVDGGTFLQGQTEPALKVEGTAAHPGQYVAIIKDNDAGAHALRVDGDVHLFGNNTLRGRLVANNLFGSSFSINTGLGPDDPADPDIFIGQAHSTEIEPGRDGNYCFINSNRVRVGGNGTAITSDMFPVAINGPAVLSGSNGIETSEVALKTEALIESTGIKLPDNKNEIGIGQKNHPHEDPVLPLTVISVGEGANRPVEQQQPRRGSQVYIRGNVTIQPGESNDHPLLGDLSVPRNVLCGGNLTTNGFSFLNGGVDMSSFAQIDGALTVGTAQANANTTLNGNLTVGTTQVPANATINGNLVTEGDAAVGGNLELADKFKVTDSVNCLANTFCEKEFHVAGVTTVDNNASISGALTVDGAVSANSDLDLVGKLTVNGSSNLTSELEVQGVSRFNARTHHMDGVALTAPGTSFTGMIAQNNRLEFFLAGTLRYYIDGTGGHNA